MYVCHYQEQLSKNSCQNVIYFYTINMKHANHLTHVGRNQSHPKQHR